ncbi:hypothetical protein AUP68_15174 [Ilyonectria robusta]
MMFPLRTLPLAAAIWAQSVKGAHYTNFLFPDCSEPQPFELRLDDSFLEMALRKEWTLEGPTSERLADVAEYWGTKYDWRSVEERINRDYHHYATTVSGSGNYTQDIPLHFLHHRSARDDAMPLLLLHGWPSSVLEWSKVIKPLSEHQDQPFHVVAPDLPGFGFSPAPKQPGLGPREMGDAFDKLMHQLGYDRYGLVTTDLGWFTGLWMVGDQEDSVIGHMTDFIMLSPTPDDRARLDKGDVSDEELRYIKASDHAMNHHLAYFNTHTMKPLALSQALTDSPVGFLGWCWDISYAASDGYPYTHEELITDAMMAWIPGPYANIRGYWEYYKASATSTYIETEINIFLANTFNTTQHPYATNYPQTKVPSGVSEWGFANGPFPALADFAFVVSLLELGFGEGAYDG